MKINSTFFLCLLLAGCASNSGIIPVGQDTYMIAKQASTGFTGLGNLKAEAFQEANQHCSSLNKGIQVVSAAESSPPYIFGNYPRAEVHFRCVNR